MKLLSKITASAIVICLSFFLAGTSLAKIEFSRIKSLDMNLDGKTFTNMANETVNLSVLNAILGIPFSDRLKTYMEFSIEGDQGSSLQSGLKALFRRYDPLNPEPVQISTLPNKLSAYLSPQMLGTLLAEYLIADKKNSLRKEDRGNISLDNKKKALAIKFVLRDEEFRRKLGEHQRRYILAKEALEKNKDLGIAEVRENADIVNYAFNPKKADDVAKIQDWATVDPEMLWALLGNDLRRSINSTLNIFEGPPNLIRIRVLLAYLWLSSTNEEDFWNFYAAVETRLQKYDPKIEMLPQNKLGWLDDSWNRQDLVAAKFSLDNNRYSEMVAKSLMATPASQAPISYGTTSSNWPDCCGASLRTFIAFNFVDVEKSKFVVHYDTEALRKLGASNPVVAFFTKYNTRPSQDSQEARDEWGSLQARLWGVRYKWPGYGEMRSGAPNMFKAVQRLLFQKALKKPKSWDDVAKAIDPLASAKEELGPSGKYGRVTFDMPTITLEWGFHDGHFFVNTVAQPHLARDLFIDMGKDPKILNSAYYEEKLSESDNLRWVELLYSVNIRDVSDHVLRMMKKNSSQNLPSNSLYYINLDQSYALQTAVQNIGPQNPDLFAGLIKVIADKHPLILDQVVFNVGRTNNEAYLKISIKYMNKFSWGDWLTWNRNQYSPNSEKLSNAFLAELTKQIATHKNMKIFDLRNINTSDIGGQSEEISKAFLELLKNTQKNKSITDLTIDFDAIKNSTSQEAIADNMTALTSISTLKDLKVHNKIPDNKLFDTIAKLPLRKLSFNGAQLSDEQVELLAKALGNKYPALYLSLAGNNFSLDALKQLDKFFLEGNDNLKILNISDNKVLGTAGYPLMQKRFNLNKSLERIYIPIPQNVAGTFWYSMLPNMPQVTQLNELVFSEALTRRTIFSPFQRGFRYLYTYIPTRQYSTVPFDGTVQYTQPNYRANSEEPNVIYNSPLFVYSKDGQKLTIMPGTAPRMQLNQPYAFSSGGLIPWNSNSFARTWDLHNWRKFTTTLRRIPI